MELQLAIDLLNKEEATKLANKVKDYVDIVEIGTPIVINEGLPAVKQFKNKESLLYAGLLPVIKDNIAPTVAMEFMNELKATNTLSSFINTFVDNRSEFMYKNRLLLKVILNEAMTSEVFQSVVLEIFNKRLVSNLKPMVQRLIDQGEMRDVKIEYFVRTLIAQLMNLNIGYLIDLNGHRGGSYDQHLSFTKESLYYMFKA